MTNVSICLRMKEAAFPKDTFSLALKSVVKISAVSAVGRVGENPNFN